MDILTIIVGLIAFAIGSVLASFYGVIIYRLPKKESIILPSSYCHNCYKPIKWYDNIPIISYILLKGKCRYCKNKIPISSFLYELFGGIISLIIIYVLGLTYQTIFVFCIIQILYLIAGYDYKTYEIPDIFLVIFGLIGVGFFFFIIFYPEINQDYLFYILGGVIATCFFGLIKLIGRVILKKDILGTGDIILFGIAGFFLGVFNMVYALLIASLIGSIVELIKMKITKKDQLVAFGPYLALGIFIALLSGNYLLNALIY